MASVYYSKMPWSAQYIFLFHKETLKLKFVVILFFRHGLVRTDYHVLNDPELCFAEILTRIATQAKQSERPISDTPAAVQVQNVPNNLDTPKDGDTKPLERPKNSTPGSEDTGNTSIQEPTTEKQEWADNKQSPGQQSDGQYSTDGLPKTTENEELEPTNTLPPVGVVMNSIGLPDEDSQIGPEGGVTGFGESTMVPVKWPKVCIKNVFVLI